MTAIRRTILVPTAGALFAAAVAILPAATGAAAEPQESPLLSYDLAAATASTPAAEDATPAIPAEAPVDLAALECMSKVVHHEARGQPRRGQLAVAQALINRLHAGRFGSTICEVANQRGQFFDTTRYEPRRDSADWAQAEDVSRAALTGEAEAVAPGALFFRASYAQANSFFRSRQRVATVGGQIFYR